MYVYLAGPIKEGAAEHKAYRLEATAYFQRLDIDVFDPAAAWGGGVMNHNSKYSAALIDLLAVKQSAAVLARYGSNSFGTNAEVGYALAFGKIVVMWGEGVLEATSAMLNHPDIHRYETLNAALSGVAFLLPGPHRERSAALRG